MSLKIPLSQPDVTNLDKKAVLEVLNTSWLSLGPKLKEFEERVAEYVGAKRAIAVSNGTCALHLIIKALNLGKRDEVITTPFSFVSSSNCILYEGAKPVFVDIDPQTLCIDAEKIEKAITRKTKAILAVDVFGHPADWQKIKRIAKKHKLYLIGDSAESLGSKYKNKKCGTFADASIFSFYPNKQITTGEGGMVITNNPKIAEICESLRNQGRAPMKKEWNWLSHPRIGYNYRISDINCALGIAQLKRIEKIISKRRKIANLYNQKLKNISGIEIPYIASNIEMSWFVYVIRLKENYKKIKRDDILLSLRKKGIGCSNYFSPIHLQPPYKKIFGYKVGDFPICENISQRTIALPFYNNLKEEEMDYIVKVLEGLLK
jgi:perosamine synthetase